MKSEERGVCLRSRDHARPKSRSAVAAARTCVGSGRLLTFNSLSRRGRRTSPWPLGLEGPRRPICWHRRRRSRPVVAAAAESCGAADCSARAVATLARRRRGLRRSALCSQHVGHRMSAVTARLRLSGCAATVAFQAHRCHGWLGRGLCVIPGAAPHLVPGSR